METIKEESSTLPVRAGEAITHTIHDQKDRPVLLLFSGGSALSIIEHIDPTLFAGRATLGVLDERIDVPLEESNTAQLEATEFYKKAREGGASIIDPRGIEGESLEETAVWFETTLRAWFQENEGGLVLITQGVGEDGHTAGILPYPEDPDYFNRTFDTTERFVVGYEVSPEKNQFTKRVTVTLPFLRQAVTSSIVYVAGAKKKDILEQLVREPHGSLAEMPARVIHAMDDVLLFTDADVSTTS